APPPPEAFGDADRIQSLRDVMGPDQGGPVRYRPGRGGPRAGQAILGACAAGDGAEKRLSGYADAERAPQRRQLTQARQHLRIPLVPAHGLPPEDSAPSTEHHLLFGNPSDS